MDGKILWDIKFEFPNCQMLLYHGVKLLWYLDHLNHIQDRSFAARILYIKISGYTIYHVFVCEILIIPIL